MLAMAFTGYLLPWDQKAYFATTVGTNMASEVPSIGAGLKRLMRGGNEMGTLTLSRFFVAHVFLLPAAIIGLVAAHVYLFLLSVDDHGITCWAKIDLDGELVKFNPPQTMIAVPLKKGAAWDFNGRAGELKVQQHYAVVGEDKTDVPAGEFHAYRIHGEQTSPNRMTIDRWFAPGVGIIKDVTTMQDANGDLLQRISLELAEGPKIVERPEVKSDATPKQLAVSLAKDRFGKPVTTFSSNTPEIYARWQGQRLRQGASVKAVWIAESIGEDFPQDYKVISRFSNGSPAALRATASAPAAAASSAAPAARRARPR